MQPNKSTNSQKERIHNRLNTLVGAGAAAFYLDACRLMEMEVPLDSTTHLVGHLLREIESSLCDVIEPFSDPKASSKKVKCPSCEHEFLNPDIKPNPRPTHSAKIQAVLNLLSISHESSIGKLWLSLPHDKKYGLQKLTHRDGLAKPLFVDTEFRDFWIEIQAVFDLILERFEAFAIPIRNRLDELLVKVNPTSEDIKTLSSSTPNSYLGIDYFFEKLEYPEWLKPLHKRGFFKHPPNIEIDPEGKTFRFYVWEQSRYLRRVASDKPEEVLEIGMQLFDRDCKNILIYEDMAEAALKMPPEQAAHWVERATQWLKEQDPFSVHTRLPEILGKLINYLSSKNQVDVAINLARELLAILSSSSKPDNSSYGEPVIRFKEYYYSKIIKENVLTAFNGQSNAVLTMFCDLLDKYLRLSLEINQDSITEDNSYFWCPSLDNISGNQYNIKNLLAVSIWEVTKQLLEIDSSQANSLCQKFHGFRWRIFDRIAIHVMLHSHEQIQDVISERLLDRNRIKYRPKEILYSQEHSRLLQKQFSHLSTNSQSQIFQWLLEDPLDTQIDDIEKREIYIKYWRRDWLSVISDYLPPELNQIYLQLDQEIGLITDTTNRQLPKSEEELVQLVKTDIKVLINYLKEHPQAQNNFYWALVITPYAQKFVNEIEQFKELDVHFMGCLLRGLEKSIRENKSEQLVFSWKPVIDFCAWILDDFKEICDYSSSSEWSRLCDDVVSLIDAGLKAKGLNKIPLTLHIQIWKILEHLTNDRYVTPSFSIYYQESKESPYEVSLNTVRGRAMRTVIRYVRWIRQDADGNVSAAIDFQDVPEVQQVLEQHLDPKQDPSLAIRSVYGAWFTTIYHIDSDWTVQHIDQIFPEEPDSKELFESAWEGYILNNQVYSNVFNILREKYKYVIENLSDKYLTSREQSDSNRSLSCHLLDLFWWKVIDLDESDKLIENFFANVPVYARSKFIHDIGRRLLYGTKEPDNIQINQELGQRLQKLFDWRISKIQEDKLPIEQVADLKYFSCWFASGKLDNQWAITKLIEVLSIVETVEYCEDFLERLEYLASEMSQEAVQCLSLLANGSRAIEWFRWYRSSHFVAILRSAIESGDEVSQNKAKELINQLVARNLADFRELLLTPD